MLHKVFLITVMMVALTVSGCGQLSTLPTEEAVEVGQRDNPRLVPQVAESVPLIKANLVHADGITGSGVRVWIIDSGSHGEWVRNIIKAVAPGASVTLCETGSFVDKATGKTALYRAGIQRCLEQAAKEGGRIINMSFGSGYATTPCTSQYDAQFKVLSSKNVLMVAAAGNDGYTDGINDPACDSRVISVGATWDTWRAIQIEGCLDIAKTDTLVCYSNRASFMDVVAPGSRIDAGLGPSYRDGTSAAAPHVAGVLALMVQANSQLTLSQARSILRSTGPQVCDSLISKNCWRRVDALAAVQAVKPKVTTPRPFPDPSWSYIRQSDYTGIKEGWWVYWRIHIARGDFEVQEFTTYRNDRKSGEAWLLSEEQYKRWEQDLPVKGWRWYSGESSRALGVTTGSYYFLIYNRRDWDGDADLLGYTINARYR
jgi:hypothetical protein